MSEKMLKQWVSKTRFRENHIQFVKSSSESFFETSLIDGMLNAERKKMK